MSRGRPGSEGIRPVRVKNRIFFKPICGRSLAASSWLISISSMEPLFRDSVASSIATPASRVSSVASATNLSSCITPARSASWFNPPEPLFRFAIEMGFL
jgi:hypothetical protein